MFFGQQKINRLCNRLCLLSILLLYAGYSHSEELAPVHIDASQSVIYCDVSSTMGDERLAVALKEGSLMTYRWDVIIEEVRDYWLNKELGSVQVMRQVVPDLVLRQWLLKDANSGIASITFSTKKAASFLSSLKHFPIIDKSLLQSGTSYQVRARLYIEEGEVSDGWWSDYTKLGKTVAVGTFTLP